MFNLLHLKSTSSNYCACRNCVVEDPSDTGQQKLSMTLVICRQTGVKLGLNWDLLGGRSQMNLYFERFLFWGDWLHFLSACVCGFLAACADLVIGQ